MQLLLTAHSAIWWREGIMPLNLCLCGSCILLMTDASFTSCHEVVNPAPYAMACSESLCAYPMVDGLGCRFFQAYAEACRLSDSSLGNSWTSSTTCCELQSDADTLTTRLQSLWGRYCGRADEAPCRFSPQLQRPLVACRTTAANTSSAGTTLG